MTSKMAGSGILFDFCDFPVAFVNSDAAQDIY